MAEEQGEENQNTSRLGRVESLKIEKHSIKEQRQEREE